MIDFQPLTAAESVDDFGRGEIQGLIDPREREGVDSPEDQLDALIADELFTA
jgi:hypothetical protein